MARSKARVRASMIDTSSVILLVLSLYIFPLITVLSINLLSLPLRYPFSTGVSRGVTLTSLPRNSYSSSQRCLVSDLAARVY